MVNNKLLNVRHGTIYTQDGIGMDNIAIIFDKSAGLLKYGDTEKSDIKEYYNVIQNQFRQLGLNDDADDILYIEFDRYKNALTIEEICTFLNYILMVSANSKRIFNMLSMAADEIKKELNRLSELGF